MLKFRCRHSKIPAVLHMQNALESPICTLCNDNVTGDEFHVLLKCSFFEKNEKSYFEKMLYASKCLYPCQYYEYKKSARLTDLSRFIRIIMSCYR